MFSPVKRTNKKKEYKTTLSAILPHLALESNPVFHKKVRRAISMYYSNVRSKERKPKYSPTRGH